VTPELADRMDRLFSLGLFGLIAVNVKSVNLDDLLGANGPGAIVRVMGSPADHIQYIASPSDNYGVVAGWISEDE
jgi:hypothetical protein